MFTVPDALAAFYLICFLLGLVFVLVSALLGAGHDLFHLHLPGAHGSSDVGHAGVHVDGVLDAGAGGHAPTVHADGGAHATHANATDRGAGGKDAASPLNLMTLMAFLTWFGGAGYILYVYYGVWPVPSLLAAIVPGLLAGWLVYLFLVKVLLPGTSTWNPAEHEIVGRMGHVTIAIPASGIGEVVYTLDGARHSDGAVSVNGLAIPKEAEVVIVGFEKGIAQVEAYPR